MLFVYFTGVLQRRQAAAECDLSHYKKALLLLLFAVFLS